MSPDQQHRTVSPQQEERESQLVERVVASFDATPDPRLAELMQASDTPEYLLRDQSFAAALAAWSRAEAIVYLLTTFITEQGLAKAFAGRGLLIETLRRWETTAANHRRRLGLDPESRARIMRDLSAARFMSGPDPLSVSLDRIAAERAALEAGERGEGA